MINTIDNYVVSQLVVIKYWPPILLRFARSNKCNHAMRNWLTVVGASWVIGTRDQRVPIFLQNSGRTSSSKQKCFFFRYNMINLQSPWDYSSNFTTHNGGLMKVIKNVPFYDINKSNFNSHTEGSIQLYTRRNCV